MKQGLKSKFDEETTPSKHAHCLHKSRKIQDSFGQEIGNIQKLHQTVALFEW